MQKGGGTTKDSLVSTTSGAVISCDTDLENDVHRIPGAIGWVAAQVYASQLRGGAPSGSLGYKVGAAAAVDAAITQTGTLAWNSVVFTQTGTDPIPSGVALELRHTKAADGTSGRCAALHALVEVIGRFGPEDDPVVEDTGEEDPEETPADDRYPNGLHNCHFPLSPWHNDQGALGPIVVIGGTYAGNSLGQTLSFPVPPAFIVVRPTTGISEPHIFFPTIFEGHNGHDQGGTYVTRFARLKQDHSYVPVSEDADQQMKFDVEIAGSNAAVNASGSTYQYIAFCDPAARFSRAGVITGKDNISPFTSAIHDAEFLAEILFAWQEAMSATTTDTLNMQGPGTTAGSMQLLTGSTTIASAITNAIGQLTVGAAWVATSFMQYPYLLFRRADGNDHPDQGKVMFLGTYTGDGAASRTIAIAPATGLRPLYCIVQPANAASVYRDPSHTTNTSNAFNNASTITTGITAGGIDQFTVGSTLNANGVVYNYFGFLASATAGNGGWGTNGTYTPVPADSPNPSDWDEPEELPFDDEDDDDEPDPNDPDALTTDIAENCVVASTRLCNRALSRLGITARLTNLATDDSVEADQFRLVYKGEVDAVLRAYPWQFATAYADVVHVGGVDADAPVTGDWVHSYRQPSDCVFVRRIVRPTYRRTYDPDPVAFRTFADDDRQLLYANEPGEKLEIDDTWVDADGELDPTQYTFEIEYTRRVDCPASRGDSIFRSCVAWRLAAAVAMAMGKDTKLAEWCLKNFLAELPRAEVITAREQTHQDKGTGDPDWITGR
jgi:hypothetical protein